jgi:hypothetical protein
VVTTDVKKRPLDLQWHAQHRLGRGARLDDRVRWHVEHTKVCGCRPIPATVLEEIERRAVAPGEGGTNDTPAERESRRPRSI